MSRLTAKSVQERIGEIQARMVEIETWETDAILVELGRLVCIYEVLQSPVWVMGTNATEPHPEYPFCFAISYSIDMGGYDFNCTGTSPETGHHHSLREAALYSLRGAVSMLGPDA